MATVTGVVCLMARTYKERTIPARTERIIDELTCDICQRKAPDPHGIDTKWGSSHHKIASVVVSLRIGERYPETWHYSQTCFDICPTCFKDHVIPFLADLGAYPRETEHSDF